MRKWGRTLGGKKKIYLIGAMLLALGDFNNALENDVGVDIWL